MTMSADRCYRHASRVALGALRALRVRVTAALTATPVLAGLLLPGELAPSMVEPVPVLRAAPGAEAAASGAQGPAVMGPVDPFRGVAMALRECTAPLSRQERRSMARIIHHTSGTYGYDPLLVTALVQVESGCSRTARGGAAIGLAQLLPSTARDVARRAGVRWRGTETLTEPAASLAIAVRYLHELERQFGDTYRALAAYNMGPARAARMSSGRARTVRYVRKVLSRYERLRKQHT